MQGEGSSSPSAWLVIVRRRRQSQHEASSEADDQQQREAEHHLEHEFPTLKTSHPQVQTEEGRRAGYVGSSPSTVSWASRAPSSNGCAVRSCHGRSPEQLALSVLQITPATAASSSFEPESC